MVNVIDFRSFDPRFKSGLIFSIFEGLLYGQSIKLIFNEDPVELRSQFVAAQVKNYVWHVLKVDAESWEVEISKECP